MNPQEAIMAAYRQGVREGHEICPFRSETHYEYVNIDGNAIVIDTQTETFPECYGNQCPLYKYEVGRGFYCTQADTMGGGTEEDE